MSRARSNAASAAGRSPMSLRILATWTSCHAMPSRAPATIPAKAAAGKRFTVAFRVTRGGAVLDSGTMICDPSIGGTVIPHAESYAGGTAKLSFTVPKTAKGKLLKVKVTIKVDNQSTTRIATFHVG